MEKRAYQRKRREASERKVIRALIDGNRTFTELLSLTGLSKPTLTYRLDDMKYRGIIMKTWDPQKEQVVYVLRKKDEMVELLSFYKSAVNGMFKEIEKKFKDKNSSDIECIELLSKKIGAFTLYSLDMSINYQEDGEWLTESFSRLVNKLLDLPKERLGKLGHTLRNLHPDEVVFFDNIMTETKTKLKHLS